jgi:uncharacterized protein (DUF1778 family)
METKPEQRGRGRPATGQTPKRYFRMDDDGWAQVENAAVASGETTSEYVRNVLLKDASRILRDQKKA